MILHCVRLNRLCLIENNNRFYFIQIFFLFLRRTIKWISILRVPHTPHTRTRFEPKKKKKKTHVSLSLMVLQSNEKYKFCMKSHASFTRSNTISMAILLIISFKSQINYGFLLAANIRLSQFTGFMSATGTAAVVAVHVSRFAMAINFWAISLLIFPRYRARSTLYIR